MRFEAAPLEEWMRRYYFSANVDIGSSGVSDLTLADVREITGLSCGDLDAVVLRDSTSYGGDEVRAVIAARWGNGDPAWVMVTHGASEAIYLAASALLEPGDEVVALEPSYHSHTSIARSLGVDVRPWRLDPARAFAPDIADLAAVVGARTRAIIVNFPHNPTGASITPEQCADLVAVAEGVGAYLLWDSAFSELVYEGEPLPDPVRVYGRAISIGTFSKAFGLPGLRFGWCIAHPDVLAALLNLRDRITLHLSPLIELIAAHVVEHADVLLRRQLGTVRTNLRLVAAWAAANAEHLEFVPPRGGVTVFPRFVHHDDTEPLCHALAQDRRVLLVPGRCFGDPTRVRLGFGGPTARVRRGLDALGGALAAGIEPAAEEPAPCIG